MPSEKSRKQLKKEVLRLEQKVSDLQTRMSSTGEAIADQSIVGVQTLTMVEVYVVIFYISWEYL